MDFAQGGDPHTTVVVCASSDPKWRDWFSCDVTLARRIAQTPGIRIQKPRGEDPGYTIWLHRSHLPLLTGGVAVQGAEEATPEMFSVASSAASAIVSDHVLGVSRPYQVAAADYCRSRQGVLLADVPRLGKTLTSLLTHKPSEGQLFIVCPLSVKSVWKNWIARVWKEDVGLYVVRGRTYDPEALKKADVVVVHYDVLPAWQSMAWLRPARLILDEIHILSNSRSLRSAAALWLSSQSGAVVGLSGTPLWNEPSGLHPILQVLNGPAWGSWKEFATRYSSGRQGAYGFVTGDPSNVDELQLRLQEVMIRRLWKDVRKDLPDTVRLTELVPVSAQAEMEIDMAAEMLRSSLGKESVIGTLARLRRALGEMKAPFAADWIRRHEGEPLVVWGWHKDVLSGLAQKESKRTGRPTFIVHGEVGGDERDDRFEAWRETRDGVLLISIACGQVGIDLSHATKACFAELDWTPAVMSQAEMRTFSPERAMEITFLAAEHRSDYEIVQGLLAKFKAADAMGVPCADDDSLDELGKAFGVEDQGDLARLKDLLMGDD